MKKRVRVKSKQHHFMGVFYLVAVVAVALIIELIILESFNKKNSNKTSLVLLDQVTSIIEENEKNENELMETLKEDYIIRAQTVSYLLDSKPEAEKDVSELQKIAGMMQIDEIHLFNKKGKIYSGTEPKYYGYSFDSGEQMAYFKPMLKDKSLTMCQDVTPNTAEGKSMMYAITWNATGDKMIQVGIEPVRLLEELRSNEITEVVANMPVYEGIDIWVAEEETGEIAASTNKKLVGSTLDNIGITETDFDSDTAVNSVVQLDGDIEYCNSMKVDEYIVVVAYSAVTNRKNFLLALVIEFVYLMLAGAVILHMFRRVLRADDEKNRQMEILVSMSDIYNSMHLIDIESNTVMEYKARDEVSEVVNNSRGAVETMRELMLLTTEEEYCDEALEFTDVRTISERMRNKKIISKEFMSKAIGWYRGSFITIEKDLEGYPTKVIYVTQNIDKEKKKEEELILKSNEDELTGLFNRRAYEDDIVEHDDAMAGENFVFVSLDVNGLKTVNDTLGHTAGDELLVGAAECMKRCFDPYGRTYRIGGDEFAAILFASETQLQHIKKDFEEVTTNWSGHLVESLSVSCGYVTRREAADASVHEIADLADKRMYAVKAEYYGGVKNFRNHRTYN